MDFALRSTATDRGADLPRPLQDTPVRWFARFAAALLAISSVLALLPGLALADDPLEGLTAMPPVGVAVTQEGVDPQGHWTQTIRLTINSGGSLSDASTLVYGDPTHVDELFAGAK